MDVPPLSFPHPIPEPCELRKGLAGGFGSFRHFTSQVPLHIIVLLQRHRPLSLSLSLTTPLRFCLFSICGRSCHCLCPPCIIDLSSLTSDPPYEAVAWPASQGQSVPLVHGEGSFPGLRDHLPQMLPSSGTQLPLTFFFFLSQLLKLSRCIIAFKMGNISFLEEIFKEDNQSPCLPFSMCALYLLHPTK